MIFIRYPFHCGLRSVDFPFCVDVATVKETIECRLGFSQFALLRNGRPLEVSDIIPDNATVEVTLSLPGGKGGFGSMLRAIGAQIEKTTNREACRDLSGRRLRDINEEQRLKKWIGKEGEREAQTIMRRQARIERLKSKAPHKFFDYEYEKEISELPTHINDALTEGLQKSSGPSVKSLENKDCRKRWLAEDLPTSSDSESDDSSIVTETSPSKKRKICKEDPCCTFKVELTENTSDEMSTDSYRSDSKIVEHMLVSPSSMDCEFKKNIEDVSDEKNTEDDLVSNSDSSSLKNNVESKNDSPIELLDFQRVSDLEELGLDQLKSALVARGLKCGGTLTERAERLWKIRGLQPNEYPANLITKNKKLTFVHC